jgi:hypothetical protein
VRRVDNTDTQCDPKTLDTLVHYIPYCRLKGKFWDKFFEQSNQGLDSLKCLSQNVGLKTVVLSLITVLSLAARTTSLIMHANGTAEPLASPPPQDKTNGPEI